MPFLAVGWAGAGTATASAAPPSTEATPSCLGCTGGGSAASSTGGAGGSELEAKVVLNENISTPIYVQCDTCIDKRFAVKNSGISCLSLIFNLNNPRMKILHAKNWFKVARYDEPHTIFFGRLIRTESSVVKGNHSLSLWVAWHGFNSRRVLKLTAALGHFAWCWAHQCTDTRAFILLHSL